MNKEKENKIAEISARITEVLQYTGDTRNSFAVKLGYDRAQTVYDVINMKSAPSYDFFRRFSISEYSEIIDLKWLLSGEGSMLRADGAYTHVVPLATDTSNEGVKRSDAVVLRLMDKLDEKEAENKELTARMLQMSGELGTLKAQLIHQHQEKPQEVQGIAFSEAFTSDSSGSYIKDSSPMKKPTTSAKSSATRT